MKKVRIGLFAALPWELHAFKRGLEPWSLLCRKPFRTFSHPRGDRELLLVETGMGKEMVETALNWAYWSWPFDLLVSFGFAGALHESMRVGQCFFGRDFHYLDTQSLELGSVYYTIAPHATVLAFCESNNAGLSRIITTLRQESKSLFPEHLKTVPTVVDMETYFSARFANEYRLPFFCFRSISDAYHHELGFQVEDICDEKGHVRIPRVVRNIKDNPSSIRSFLLSWVRSRVAGRNLGRLMKAFVSLPCSWIVEMTQSKGDWPETQRVRRSF